MFDFIFKRAPKQVGTKPAPITPVRPAVAPAALYDARTAARHRAESLQHDEAGSLAFLLQCEFAEARLIAAQVLQSKAAIRQALEALRNTDRRVARLMQARLDVLHGQEKLATACQECTAAAEQLVLQARLTPNQVGELDRRWQTLLPLPEALQQAFDVPRRKLAERLAAQTALQRAVIDTLANLQQLHARALEGSNAPARDKLMQIEAELVSFRTAPEAESLPKHLLVQCDAVLQSLRVEAAKLAAQRATQQAARQARLQQLDQWGAAAPETLQASVLRRYWDRPVESGQDDGDGNDNDGLQQRFELLLQRVAACQPAAVRTTPRTDSSTSASAETAQGYSEALSTMAAALEQGSLQIAADADKRIRSLDPTTLNSRPAQSAQLSRLRAELGRLQGWARWGGNVSREELQKAAEALPAQDLAVGELGKRISALRERWKSLDSSAGPAPKELWQGFDAACTVAYAPVAAHVEKQIAERQKNAEQVSALIAQIQQFADQVTSDVAPDRKVVAQFCQRSVQNFQRLIGTDRRNKKRFDAEFAQALERLRVPLAAVRQAEVALRECMITEASQLVGTERGALDRLKQLQERWQAQAKNMPLERNDEQELWRRFKESCDTVFAKRKESAAEADAERHQHLVAKETVCQTLEAAVLQPAQTSAQASIPQATVSRTALLRESAAAWSGIGPVPRAVEAALEARYRTATAALTQQIDAAQREQRNAMRLAVQSKLALCLQAEAALAAAENADFADALATIQAKWDSLGTDDTTTLRLLAQRLARALACAAHIDPAYLAQLQSNRSVVRQELLRTEIILSIDSPAESARERLQLQVEVLQSALKSNTATPTAQTQLQALCGLPVLLEPDDAARLLRVVEQLAA